MRKKIRITGIVVFFPLIFLISMYSFFFTAAGLRYILKLALVKRVSQSVEIGEIKGNILTTLLLQDVRLKDIKNLPEGNSVYMQEIKFSFINGLYIQVNNGRFDLPSLNPLIFYGNYRNNYLDAHIYSQHINFEILFELFEDLDGIKGTVDDLDFSITGPAGQLVYKGKVKVTRITNGIFTLSESPVSFDLEAGGILKHLRLYGSLYLNGGEVAGVRTAVVNIAGGRIRFEGNGRNPAFDLKGTSSVEGININIALKGFLENPELSLTSDPQKPQPELLIMLATGKKWAGVEAFLQQKQLSADVARDFIDYFLFAGSGNQLARELGLNEVSLIFEKEKKGIAVEKKVSENIGVSYGMEAAQDNRETTTREKIGGEYKITKELFVEFSRERIYRTEQKDPLIEGEIIFKFEKKF